MEYHCGKHLYMKYTFERDGPLQEFCLLRGEYFEMDFNMKFTSNGKVCIVIGPQIKYKRG